MTGLILGVIAAFGILVLLLIGGVNMDSWMTAAAESKAKANAFTVTGEVARFAVSRADDCLTEYAFKLVGDQTVYFVDTRELPEGTNGELTAPGDIVEFMVYPGLRHVRKFRNQAIASGTTGLTHID